MANNPKRPVVTFPDEPESTELQQPEEPQPETTQPQRSSPNRSPNRLSPVDEDERFYFELYPNSTRMSWAALLRLSNSPIFSRPSNDSQQEIYLQREMNLHSAISLLINVTIGTGMYLDPPVVLDLAGSVTEALLVWLFCGVFSLLVAITYGELLYLVSQSGEKFSYLLTAFSPINRCFGPLPAFLDIWIEVLFLQPSRVALLAILLAEQVYPVFAIKMYHNFNVTEPIRVKQVIGMAVIGLITCINCRSTKTFIRIQNILVVLKVFVCCMVIGAGVHNLYLGNVDSFKTLFKDMRGNSTSLLKAVYLGMHSYNGWSTVVNVSEEINNPLRNIPLAILFGVPLVTVYYLAMNISYLSVLTASEIKEASSAFVFIFGEKAFGQLNVIMPVLCAVTTLCCAMSVQFESSRSVFAAGREGHMPQVYSYLHVRRFVPIPAVLTQALLSLLFVSYLPIMDLIEYTVFVQWTFYGFSFVALIILRVTMKDTNRLYKTPLSIPIILTVLSVLVTIEPIFRSPTRIYAGTTLLLLGASFYYLFVHQQKSICGMDKFNHFVRVVLNVAPPTALPEGYTRSINARTKTVAAYLHRNERYYSL